MKTTSLLLAALLGTVTLGVQAGELYQPAQYQDAQSGLTRQAVKQSVLRERAAGGLQHNDVDLPATQTADPFGKTRAEVKAEVLAARASGGLQHDDVDLPTVASGSTRTRQDVKGEALASRRARTAPGAY